MHFFNHSVLERPPELISFSMGNFSLLMTLFTVHSFTQRAFLSFVVNEFVFAFAQCNSEKKKRVIADFKWLSENQTKTKPIYL